MNYNINKQKMGGQPKEHSRNNQKTVQQLKNKITVGNGSNHCTIRFVCRIQGRVQGIWQCKEVASVQVG